MFPYILLLIVLIFGVCYELGIFSGRVCYKHTGMHDLYFTCGCLLAFILTGFRDMMGGYDVFVYASFFDSVPTLNSILNIQTYDPKLFAHFEPGYLLINSIIKTLYNNTYFFFFIVALLVYSFVYSTLYRYPFMLFSFFIFVSKFFIVGFVYTRQFIAMSIIWFALKFLEKDKKYVFLVFLFIAASIHYSALTVSLILLIYKWRFSQKILLILFVVSLFLGITPFIKILMSFVNQYMSMDKLDGYAEKAQSVFHIPYFIETSFMAFMALKYRDKIYQMSPRYVIMYNMLVLYIVFSYLTLRDAGVVRFIWYFVIGYLTLFPILIYKLVKNRWLLIFFIALYFSFVYFRNVTVRDDGSNVPYRTFIFKN